MFESTKRFMFSALKGPQSIGLMWWLLAREVLRLRGTISREHPWEVMVDLYFYRDPEEVTINSSNVPCFAQFRGFYLL